METGSTRYTRRPLSSWLASGVEDFFAARAAAREAAAEAASPPHGQFLHIAGRRVHALIHEAERPGSPDLILLHGASGNLREFDEFGARLARHFRVIAFDRPGLGHSEGLDLSDVSITAQARHLAEAASQLGLRNPLILGHSYGGSVALAWALEGFLDPSGLILVSAPSLPWDGGLDYWHKLTDTGFGQRHAIPAAAAFVPDFWVQRMVTEVFAPEPIPQGYSAAKGIPLAVRRVSLRHNTEQINRLHGELTAHLPRHASLTLPIELLHGTADRVVPIHIHSRLLIERLPGARLTELPGAGHMPHLTRPDEVEAAVLRIAAQAALRGNAQS